MATTLIEHVNESSSHLNSEEEEEEEEVFRVIVQRAFIKGTTFSIP